MNTFDFDDEVPRKTRIANVIWNLLTAIALLVMLCMISSFVIIYLNPQSIFNPFPPPTRPVVMSLPTVTPTSINFLPPTWTPTFTIQPTITETPRPSATIPPTDTPFSFIPSTPTPENTKPPEGYRYVLKGDRPLAIPNIAHTDLGCNWMGVAGQVEDISGSPKTQLIVVLGGTLAGQSVDPSGVLYSLTGVAPQYGPAGFEFVLADKPVKSSGTLWLQLLDQNESPLSDRIYFDTYDVCEKNLIVITFKQVR